MTSGKVGKRGRLGNGGRGLRTEDGRQKTGDRRQETGDGCLIGG